MKTCTECGAVGDLGMTRLGRRDMCPRCVGRLRTKSNRTTALWLAVLVVLVAASGAIGGGALFLGVTALGIAVHELSHALVAAVMRFHIISITVGVGPRVARVRGEGWTAELRLVPFGGFVRAASRHRAGYRTRLYLMIAAGPLSNAGLAIVASVVLPRWGVEPVLVRAVVLVQFIIAIENLLPVAAQSELGMMASDGKQLLAIPGLSDEEVDAQIALYDVALREEAVRQAEGEPDAIVSATAADLIEASVTTNALHHIVALANMDEHDRALTTARDLLNRGDPDPEVRAHLLNLIAYEICVLDRVDAAGEADQASESALAAAPWSPAFQSTRGAVLAWTNRDLGDAVRLLESALEDIVVSRELSPGDVRRARGETQAFLALAHVRKQDLFAARRALAAARSGSPAFPIVAMAEAELTGLDVDHFVRNLWPSTCGSDHDRALQIVELAGAQLDEIRGSLQRFVALPDPPPAKAAVLRAAGLDGSDVALLEWITQMPSLLRLPARTRRS